MTRRHWYPAYIGIGSNLDDPASRVRSAFDSVDGLDHTQLVLQSSLYRSGPMGPQDQPEFINAVAAVLTTSSPNALLSQLQELEANAGRIPGERWGPRVLDLDLLAWSDREIAEENLVVPHPGIAERNFVLLPWREIAPEFKVPGLTTVRELAGKAPSEPAIERLA